MPTERARRLSRLLIVVAVLTIVAWALYLTLIMPPTAALSGAATGTGIAAFLLGVRHGFDADHIAAIDNVTRRLSPSGRASASVGMWFALGHSTVVCVAAVLLGAGATFLIRDDTAFAAFTSVWGPAFSGVFLLAISALNARTLIRTRRAAALGAETPGVGRFSGRIRGITRPWHMYPTGMLFGLGFDTATSVALLVAASLAASTDPAVVVGSVICLPLLFTAGMTLVDTADGAVMARAYVWSRRSRSAMLRYDVIVTGATLLVGISIGLLQLSTATGAATGLSLPFFSAIDTIDSGVLGAVAIACVLAAATIGWGASRGRSQADAWIDRAKVRGLDGPEPRSAVLPVHDSAGREED